MAAVKISASYWEKCNEVERKYLSNYAWRRGVQTCKRVISLARSFGKYDDIVCFSEYQQTVGRKILCQNCWIIFLDGVCLGYVTKTDNIGISERIHIKQGDSFVEVWNNWSKKNPPKNVLKYEVLSVSKKAFSKYITVDEMSYVPECTKEKILRTNIDL